MRKIQILFVFALLLIISYSQVVDLTKVFSAEKIANLGPQYNDPQFIKLIDNYFGCRTWENGQCTQCSQGYIFNNKGICCKIDQHCLAFNRDIGICQQCYNGYEVNSNGTCSVRDISNSPNTIGCAKWQRNRCIQCSIRYFNDSGVCKAIDNNCRDWNSQGRCTECYPGYKADNGACVVQIINSIDNSRSNPLCKKWNKNQCQECGDRTYRNNQNICTQVDHNCNTYDKLDGLCLSCYIGYDLINGTCVYSPSNTALPTDAGCRTWKNSVCEECSNNWVFDANRICIPVDSLCKTHENGVCKSCFTGYDLEQGKCVYSSSNTAPPTDGGCKKWDLDNKKCSECSNRWVFDSNGLCIPVSTDCRQHDSAGKCTSCYRGYDVVDGICTFSQSNTSPLSDKGCHIWNYTTDACQKCSNRWYKSPSGCLPVDEICQSADESGVCLSCYRGYDLINNICTFSTSNTEGPSDKGCRAWDNGVCAQCSALWVFNANKVCTAVNGLCKTHQGQACTSCYIGYDLTNGQCVFSPSNLAEPSDKGCKKWQNGICSECSPRWVFDENKICVKVNDDCRTHESNGKCSGCYFGYDLVEGACVFSQSNSSPVSDVGCHIWSYTNNICEKCSNNWVLLNGTCQQVSALCRSHDDSGKCLTCFLGYDLLDGNCIFSPSNLQGPADKGCRKWESGICVECSKGFAFNADKSCIQVSDLCKTSQGLQCTSCYKGYILADGKCTLPQVIAGPTDSGCSKWNWDDQVCLQCGAYWYLSEGKCKSVSEYCKTWSNQNGLCLSCYKGYTLNNGVCELAPNQEPKDPGCADWNWDQQTCNKCSKGFVNIEGVCQPVSPFCKTHQQTSTKCTSCFQGYALNKENGACQVAQNSCKTSNDEGCLSCYNGYALYQKDCIPLISLADIALYYSECCPQKLESLRAEGRLSK